MSFKRNGLGVLVLDTGVGLTTGTDGKVSVKVGDNLTVDSNGDIDAPAPAGFNSPLTAKGDMLVMDDSLENIRLPVGANDTVPIADNTVPAGVRWGAPPPSIPVGTVYSTRTTSGALTLAPVMRVGGTGQSYTVPNGTTNHQRVVIRRDSNAAAATILPTSANIETGSGAMDSAVFSQAWDHIELAWDAATSKWYLMHKSAGVTINEGS